MTTYARAIVQAPSANSTSKIRAGLTGRLRPNTPDYGCGSNRSFGVCDRISELGCQRGRTADLSELRPWARSALLSLASNARNLLVGKAVRQRDTALQHKQHKKTMPGLMYGIVTGFARAWAPQE